jgi:proline iminopeptidase
MTASIESYVAYLNFPRSKFPQEIQDKLKSYEVKEDFFNPEYEKIMFENIYTVHLCRSQPWPEALIRAFSHSCKC